MSGAGEQEPEVSLPDEYLRMELDPQRLEQGLREAVAMGQRDPVIYAVLLLTLTLLKALEDQDRHMGQITAVLEKQIEAIQIVARRVGLSIPRSGTGPKRTTDLN